MKNHHEFVHRVRHLTAGKSILGQPRASFFTPALAVRAFSPRRGGAPKAAKGIRTARRLRLEREAKGRPSLLDRFTEKRWEVALRLIRNLRVIFDSPTTSNRDRKELIRMVVERVVIERSRERARVKIVWKDGSAPTEGEIKLTPLAQKRMLELDAAGVPQTEIAETLNREGYRTRRDGFFSADTVAHNLKKLHSKIEGAWIGRNVLSR